AAPPRLTDPRQHLARLHGPGQLPAQAFERRLFRDRDVLERLAQVRDQLLERARLRLEAIDLPAARLDLRVDRGDGAVTPALRGAQRLELLLLAGFELTQAFGLGGDLLRPQPQGFRLSPDAPHQ